MAIFSAQRNDNPQSDHPSLNSAVEIAGGDLPDGRTVDLIKDGITGRLQFVWSDGDQYYTGDHIGVGGHVFIPVALDPTIQRAVLFPTTALDYKSAELLFDSARDVLVRHGVSQEAATTATYFAFASWFPDRSLPMPCLMITGPPGEAHLLLLLMGCLVRRALPMLEIDSKGFSGPVDILHPTIIVDARHISRRGRHLLSASSLPGVYLPRNRSVSSFSFPKIIYAGTEPIPDFSADYSLQVRLSPSRGGVAMLDEEKRHHIIAEFQPQFLAYRLKNRDKVRASYLEIPGLTSENQVISQIFGGAIVGAPDIQPGVQVLLQKREDQLRTARWTDLPCVLVEVLLSFCHKKPLGILHVKEIALAAEVALKCRGEILKLEPRQVGVALDGLGLFRKRDQRGFRLQLTAEIQRKIHILARDYQVESIRECTGKCDHCAQVLGTTGTGSAE